MTGTPTPDADEGRIEELIGYVVEDSEGNIREICGPYDYGDIADEKCKHHVQLQRVAHPAWKFTIFDADGVVEDEPLEWPF